MVCGARLGLKAPSPPKKNIQINKAKWSVEPV